MANVTADLIDSFCDQVWLQDGLAPTSLVSYRRDLTQWAAWLESRGRTLLAAHRMDVEAWLADQFRAKAKATSIARRLSSDASLEAAQWDKLIEIAGKTPVTKTLLAGATITTTRE